MARISIRNLLLLRMTLNRSFIAFISINLIILANCSCNNLSEKEIVYRQSFESGKALYNERCANCHKQNGEGLGALYPPVRNSDYLNAHWKQLPCIIYRGLKGPMNVNGVNFDWEMPGNKTMDEIQMSALLTYMQDRWRGLNTVVSYEEARKDINECEDSGVRNQKSGVRR